MLTSRFPEDSGKQITHMYKIQFLKLILKAVHLKAVSRMLNENYEILKGISYVLPHGNSYYCDTKRSM